VIYLYFNRLAQRFGGKPSHGMAHPEEEPLVAEAR
jgi:hypothetical protein